MDLRPDEAAVFNVCTGVPTVGGTTWRRSSRTLTGRSLDISTQPARSGEIRHSLGDPEPANRALGLYWAAPLADGPDPGPGVARQPAVILRLA